jgi:hypothetical protein
MQAQATITTSAATSEQAHEQQPVVNLFAVKAAFEQYFASALQTGAGVDYKDIHIYNSAVYPGSYFCSGHYDVDSIASYRLMQWEYPSRVDGEIDLPECYRPADEPGTWQLLGSDFVGFPLEVWHCEKCRTVTFSASGDDEIVKCAGCGIVLLEEF